MLGSNLKGTCLKSIVTILLLTLTTVLPTELALKGDIQTKEQNQCKPNIFADSNEVPPTCKYYYTRESSGGNRLELKCLKQGVLRVLGDYNVFYISCTAPYPLDFNFDGIRPTEAIMLDSRRKAYGSMNDPEKFLYELNLRIYSIPALRDYYKAVLKRGVNYTSSKKYSRTGEYIFSGLFDRENVSTRMYIFFEEPEATPDFIMNDNLKVLAKRDQLIIPCRPTHYEASVSIFQNENEMNLSFLPTVGFVIQNHINSTRYTSFTCTLMHGPDTTKLVLDSSGETNRSENLVYTNSDVELTPNMQTLDSGTRRVKIKCRIDNMDNEKNTTILSIIGTPNPALYKLMHKFVWPEYADRSYSVVLGNHLDNGAHDISVHLDGYVVQSAFCGNEHKNASISISSLVTGELQMLRFDTDCSKLRRNRLSTSPWFFPKPVKGGGPMYQNEEIEFGMQVSTFVFIPPCIWYVEYKNGSTMAEHINEDWHGGHCTFKRNVTTDIRNVYCSASMCSRNEWWNSSVGPSLHIQECVPPSFEAEEQTSVQVSSNSIVNLKCTAYGTPHPDVYWLRDNQRITNVTSEVSIFASSSIDKYKEGKYVCVASNSCGNGSVRKTVTVSVYNQRIHIGIYIAAAMLIMISWTIGSLYIRFLKTRTGRLSPSEIEEFFKGDGKTKYTPGRLYICPISMRYNTSLEVSRSRFQIEETRVLGTGEYGIVYFGLLDSKPVAIKTVKDKQSKAQIESLMVELKTLMYIGYHENVVQLHGAHTAPLSRGKNSLYLLVDFCPLGSLETFLRVERENYGSKFTLKDMYLWATQIANGMAHLESKMLVHGDLAARNVLLTAEKQVKITDFGLSKKLYTYAKFVRDNEEKVPWPWVAVESLTTSMFSIQSDIWSYGVTLWEIFSLADVPFGDACFGPLFIEQIQNGRRLEKPSLAPPDLYNQVMLKCWNKEPSARPSFEALSFELSSLMPAFPGYISIVGIWNER